MPRIVCFLFLILLLCESCSTSTNERDSLPQGDSSGDSTIVPTRFAKFFKLRNQKVFTFRYEDIERLALLRIDSVQFADMLSGDELIKYNRNDFTHYFYSLQESRPTFRSAVIVVNTDYRYTLFYLIYSRSGSLIAKYEIAAEGGDGEFSSSSRSHFLNDSTLQYTKVSTQILNGTVLKDSSTRNIVIKIGNLK